jgi:hypothetical protein
MNTGRDKVKDGTNVGRVKAGHFGGLGIATGLSD